jgi:hypothetical protein
MDFAAKGGRKEEAWEVAGTSGERRRTVNTAVRNRWAEAKGKSKETETLTPPPTVGACSTEPEKTTLEAVPASRAEEGGTLTRKGLLAALHSRINDGAKADTARQAENPSRAEEATVELTAAERLRRRFQSRDHKMGHHGPKYDATSAGQKKRGREEHTSARIRGALLGLTAGGHRRPRSAEAGTGQKKRGRVGLTGNVAGEAPASQKAHIAKRAKKGTEEQQGRPGQLEGGLAMGEDKAKDRERSEQARTADGQEKKDTAPATEPASHRDRTEESCRAVEDPGEANRAHSPSGRRSPTRANMLGHRLQRTGHMVWCARCGGHAGDRVGKLLKQKCHPVRPDEGGARPTRLKRLLEGKHPVTGTTLVP